MVAFTMAVPARAATPFAEFSDAAYGLTVTNTDTRENFSVTSAPVSFSFARSLFGTAGLDLAADYSLTASTTAPATGTDVLTEDGIAGSISYKSTTALTLGGVTYAAGANLLTVNFTDAQLIGVTGDTVATVIQGSTLATFFTSDIPMLAARPSTTGFSISLGSITPALARDANGFLTGFTASPAGQFQDIPVPETSTWAMMLVGFGTIGLGIRARWHRKLRTAWILSR